MKSKFLLIGGLVGPASCSIPSSNKIPYPAQATTSQSDSRFYSPLISVADSGKLNETKASLVRKLAMYVIEKSEKQGIISYRTTTDSIEHVAYMEWINLETGKIRGERKVEGFSLQNKVETCIESNEKRYRVTVQNINEKKGSGGRDVITIGFFGTDCNQEYANFRDMGLDGLVNGISFSSPFPDELKKRILDASKEIKFLAEKWIEIDEKDVNGSLVVVRERNKDMIQKMYGRIINELIA